MGKYYVLFETKYQEEQQKMEYLLKEEILLSYLVKQPKYFSIKLEHLLMENLRLMNLKNGMKIMMSIVLYMNSKNTLHIQ